MSAFCVFGMTAIIARSMAAERVSHLAPAVVGQPRRPLTAEELEAAIAAKAAHFLENSKARQISPAFDAPQFAEEWLVLARRATEVRGGSSCTAVTR